MAAKAEFKQKAAQLREDAARTGKVVLHAPGLVRLAECGIRFLLGAVLAGANVFGDYSPFGLALVGASGSGLGGFTALLGAAFGYLAFHGFSGGLRYVAAAILIFAVSFAFFDVALYRKCWFMPLAAALLNGATGFVYLSGVGWGMAELVGFSTELLLTGAGVYFYTIAFSSWHSAREAGTLSTPQLVSLLIVGVSALMALTQLTVLGDVMSLGRILAALCVMLAASQGGVGFGAAVGVAAGLCMDLTVGAPGFCTVAYGFAGLMTGVFQKQGKIFCSVVYVLANATVVLWAYRAGGQLAILYEVFAASVLFLILPDRLTRRLSLLLSREKGGDVTQHSGAWVRRRLEATSEAFRALSDSLRGAFRPGSPNDGDAAAIFDRAATRVCRSCALRDACWQRDYNATYTALGDALPAMVDRGRGEAADFPLHFSARCLHFPAFLAAANEELTALLCRRQYRAQLRESRWAVCRQYGELAEILSGAAAELSAELTPDPAREKRLRQHLAACGLEGNACVYYDQAGHLQAEVEGRELDVLKTPEEQAVLTEILGCPLRAPQDEGGRLLFTQAEPLMAVAGVAARKKDGETVSGDTGSWFKTDRGLLYILLCDGMGSGPDAMRESTLAIRLLERFLRAGVGPEAALKTLNSALALKGEEEGGFTTVDLLELDLFSGAAALCKFGAAPSYLKKGRAVRCITGASLPAGLDAGEQVNPDVTRMSLTVGDTVVLVSDGVTGGRDDLWLREALAAFDGASPKDLSRALLEHGQAGDASDDRTALVIRVEARSTGGQVE